MDNEIINLTKKMLEVISAGDWQAYAEMCDAELTAIEPESLGQIVKGLEFHKFFFDFPKPSTPVRFEVSMSDVNVKVTGHVAVISYIRLVQKHDGQAYKLTKASETRVWEKKNGSWKMIHFHRSDVQRV
jgi:calcium/calmodulin-dependent protein kinase (CaM kinase) II